MRVLMTGATGAVGRALARQLRRDGDEVTAAVRSVRGAASVLGPEITLVDIHDDAAMQAAVEAADAVVNLAGQPIADRRWSEARKAALRESRVGVTRRLAERIQRARKPPSVVVSASGVAYYAPDALAARDESAPEGSGFLAELSRDWEQAALACQGPQTRVVCLRIGMVLDSEAGALAMILPVFRACLGGRLGGGEQYMSWIHLDDLLGLVRFALREARLQGPVNAVAPHPVTNREWTTSLGKALGRPTPFPVPALALRLALGERADMLLDSVRAVPRAALDAGYHFRHARLDYALEEILGRQRSATEIRRLGPDEGNPGPRSASHVLTQATTLDAPLEEVFAFFSQARNLGWITPPWMGFAILDEPEEMQEGAVIRYAIRLGPLPMRWKTRITVWEPGRRFVDNQERGPYALWWHEHHFEAVGQRTRVTDRVYFRAPLGWLGDRLAGFFVRSSLRRIFGYRAQAMAHRFGSASPALAEPSADADAVAATG